MARRFISLALALYLSTSAALLPTPSQSSTPYYLYT